MRVFSLKDIYFTYPSNGIRAVEGVSFTIESGCIYALLGENGAGKSTLAQICSGQLTADSGSLFFNHARLNLRSTADGIKAGIVPVPQYPKFARELPVWENLAIGLHTDKRLAGAFIKRKRAAAAVKDRLEQYGISLPLYEPAKRLDTAQMYWAAFAGALLKNPAVLFLDEPTAAYSPDETSRFYGILRCCADSGTSVVVITHRIQEVLAFADRVHILREGKLVHSGAVTQETKSKDLLCCIFGTEGTALGTAAGVGRMTVQPSGQSPKNAAEQPSAAHQTNGHSAGLKLHGVTAKAAGGTATGAALRDVCFEAPRGKITGIAGIKNQGLELLEDVLIGLRKPAAGSLYFENESLSALKREKIAYIPSRKLERSVAPRCSIFENFAVRNRRSLYKWGLYEKKTVSLWKKRTKLDLKRNWDTPVFTLSGGMMQKLIFTRELENPVPELIICAEPYWGLDRKTQQVLLEKLRILAENGSAILVLSSDADAVLEICDCIHVLYNGTLQLCMERQQYSRSVLIQAMMQAKQNV